jgi:Protein kinase domain
MGVVYLASDQAGRPVAIKVLRQGIAADETARRRLAHEVATMRRVSSPNVAEVIDADVAGNPPYIVTRYVAGKTLEDVVATSGPLAGPALARLAKGLAAALCAVHSAGVVHRDFKPGNVMLLGGEPVVIDFGIARAADSTRLTMTGMFMGTPGYLAPEVIEGRASGPAADIHSWGATMAYAATGRPPFGTGTFEAIFYRIVHGQPDLSGMPAALVPLVLAALARDPARRPSATDLAESLGHVDPAALHAGPANGAAALNGNGNGVPNGNGAAVGDAAPSALTRTSPDLAKPLAAAWPAGALAAGNAAQPGVGAAAWPGTMPMATRGREDFADLLPPFQYTHPAGAAPSRPAPAWQPVSAGTGGLAGAPGPAGGAAAAMPRAGQRADATPVRLPLVAATVVALIAASILLPLGGAAIVLLILILMRSADLTGSWLTRRRSAQGPRGSDGVAAVAYFPWALFRSAIRFVLLAPLALLFATAAAAITVLAAGSSDLPRAGGWAAGALVACYCLGPGSAACRRPIGKFYGRITRSSLGAAAGFICLAVLAVVAVLAAASLAPGYWPDAHVGQQLQNAPVNHPLLSHLPGNISQVGNRVLSWVGHRL